MMRYGFTHSAVVGPLSRVRWLRSSGSPFLSIDSCDGSRYPRPAISVASAPSPGPSSSTSRRTAVVLHGVRSFSHRRLARLVAILQVFAARNKKSTLRVHSESR